MSKNRTPLTDYWTLLGRFQLNRMSRMRFKSTFYRPLKSFNQRNTCSACFQLLTSSILFQSKGCIDNFPQGDEACKRTFQHAHVSSVTAKLLRCPLKCILVVTRFQQFNHCRRIRSGVVAPGDQLNQQLLSEHWREAAYTLRGFRRRHQNCRRQLASHPRRTSSRCPLTQILTYRVAYQTRSFLQERRKINAMNASDSFLEAQTDTRHLLFTHFQLVGCLSFISTIPAIIIITLLYHGAAHRGGKFITTRHNATTCGTQVR